MALLTKSNYLKGMQCPKLLWVAKNKKDRIPEPDEVAKSKFKQGNLVGVLATRLFENGIDLSDLSFKDNLKKTKESLKLRKPIFEAGFIIDNLYSRIDILLPVNDDEWDIVEVKSGTRVKDVNIHDVSFQKYVCEKAGLKIRKCFLMHINNEYIRDGNLEIEELFVQPDIDEKVDEFSEGIEKRADDMLKIINSKKEPDCPIGINCSKPYDCPLMDECWKNVAEGSVFEFYRMYKSKCFDLHDNGIYCIHEVPEDIKLNDKQKIQRRLALASKDVPSKEGNGGKHIDKQGISNFLKNLKYPIYYLDFETINPAIPKFNGMRPYQRIPFQFSLHIQEKPGGKLKHVSFLHKNSNDPRPSFLEALKQNLGGNDKKGKGNKNKNRGSILVYNQGFEKGVLRECTDAFPDYKKWYEKNICPRIRDLWDVFKDFNYYDPKQKGSTSIKYVLPALTDLKYDGLDIQNGSIASLEYERVVFSDGDNYDDSDDGEDDITNKEKERIFEALEKYCELDTLAEVKILDRLRGIIKEGEKE